METRTEKNHRNVVKQSESIKLTQDIAVQKLNLIPHERRSMAGTTYINFIEWKDKEGNLYFRQVKGERQYVQR